MTGLPDASYEFPNNIKTQRSDLPDYSDNSARFIEKRMTPEDLFNYFSDEIKTKEDLNEIILGEKGYCRCNKKTGVTPKDFGSFKINVVKCQVKTLDWVGIYKNPKSKRGFSTITMDAKKATSKVWAQNVVEYYWLKDTKIFLGIKRIGSSYRTRGQESFQNFTSNIYKSQERSAVELSIGENKKAMIAEIKLIHAIVMSLPPGKVIDLKGMRGVMESITETGLEYTLDDLITAATEKNLIIIDTEGFEGKNDGQLKPFYEIPGGLRAEVNGYYTVIAQCAANISRFTGINDQLTGHAINPEGLVGLEKLQINASINSQHYVHKAIETQTKALMNSWANVISQAIEDGGKTKQAIINYIGEIGTKLIDGLNQIPLHNLTIKVLLTMREEERFAFQQQINFLKQQGIISTADEYLLNGLTNPKEKLRYLAIKELMWKKEREKQQAMDREAMLQQRQVANEGMVQAAAAKTDGKIKEIYAQGDVQSKILQAANQLGIQMEQIKFLSKRQLQSDRNQAQLNKAERTIDKKKEAEAQAPLPLV